METPAPPSQRKRRELAVFIAGAVIVAGIAVGVVLLEPLGTQGGLLAPGGTTVPLQHTQGGLFMASYKFSWTWGAYLRGSWVATADTVASVVPDLNCFHCPFMRIYEISGFHGTFNYTFGGVGQQYPNMSLTFSSSVPDVIRIVDPIEVVYPPMTIVYATGTVLSGTGFQARSFTLRSPGAYLVGAWTAVNTTLWSYQGTPQEATNCGGWPVDSPPMSYQGSINTFLVPGDNGVGVQQCSTRPWTVTVTAAIGYFYPD